MPPYVKIVLENEFPRSHIATHLSRSRAACTSGRSARALRRSGSNPSSWTCSRCAAARRTWRLPREHPGCIYGEMGMCLRPCQQVVGPAEYGHEVERVVEFLRTDGQSLLDAIAHSRDRLSEEMLFEEAARQHKRFEKVQEVLKLRDELARDIDRLHGVAITPSPGRLRGGAVVRARRPTGNAAALQFRGPGRQAGIARPQTARDLRRRRTAQAGSTRAAGVSGAAGALVLLQLARRRMATLREFDDIPYRKLVNAISRVSHRDSGS